MLFRSARERARHQVARRRSPALCRLLVVNVACSRHVRIPPLESDPRVLPCDSGSSFLANLANIASFVPFLQASQRNSVGTFRARRRSAISRWTTRAPTRMDPTTTWRRSFVTCEEEEEALGQARQAGRQAAQRSHSHSWSSCWEVGIRSWL